MMKIILMLSSLCLFFSCSKPNFVLFKGQTMGTYYVVKILVDSDDPGRDMKLKNGIEKRLLEINQVFSTYINDSEISSFNQLNAQELFEASPEFYQALVVAKKLHIDTDGYFDMTVGPLVNLWGFGSQGITRKPLQSQIDKIMPSLGDKNIELLGQNKVKKLVPHTEIDLNSYAEGYAVDELVKFLKASGQKNGLVDIGGEIFAFGQKGKNEYWQVGVEAPELEKGKSIKKMLEIKDLAVSTSGSYRNFVKYGEETFSHTIDTKTWAPAKHLIVSATVIDDNCARADIWSTAFMSMGETLALQMANAKNIKAYFLVRQGSQIKEINSLEMDEFLKEKK